MSNADHKNITRLSKANKMKACQHTLREAPKGKVRPRRHWTHAAGCASHWLACQLEDTPVPEHGQCKLLRCSGHPPNPREETSRKMQARTGDYYEEGTRNGMSGCGPRAGSSSEMLRTLPLPGSGNVELPTRRATTACLRWPTQHSLVDSRPIKPEKVSRDSISPFIIPRLCYDHQQVQNTNTST
jgi:hypothetical protein